MWWESCGNVIAYAATKSLTEHSLWPGLCKQKPAEYYEYPVGLSPCRTGVMWFVATPLSEPSREQRIILQRSDATGYQALSAVDFARKCVKGPKRHRAGGNLGLTLLLLRHAGQRARYLWRTLPSSRAGLLCSASEENLGGPSPPGT
jgi:hypothetical protein